MRQKLIALLFVFPLIAYGHGDEDHSKEKEDDGWETVTEEIPKEKLVKINRIYLKKIRPIFQKKCLDCHGTGNKLPWYASIPGPKHLIQYDVTEAKKHMDMSNDFPFSGHGTPEDDLKALRKTVEKGDMPPLRYKIMHWNSSLTDEEKKAINEWVAESLNILNQKQEEKK